MKTWEILTGGYRTGWKVGGRTYYEALIEAMGFFPYDKDDIDVKLSS